MLGNFLVFLLMSKISVAQINGEFWWLSDKVKKINGGEPPLPKFEELNEFDTDESAKIIFKDDPLISVEESQIDFEHSNTIDRFNTNMKPGNNSFDMNAMIFPDDKFRKPYSNKENTKDVPSSKHETTNDKKNHIDVFIFKFPDDDDNLFTKYPSNNSKAELLLEPNHKNTSVRSTKPTSKKSPIKLVQTEDELSKNKNTYSEDLFIFKFPDENIPKYTSESPHETIIQRNDSTDVLIDNNGIFNSLHDESTPSEIKKTSHSENICSYLKKRECYHKNGIIYNSERLPTRKQNEDHLICCVLPLQTVESSKIVFPDSSEQLKRFRRSNKQDSSNPTLRQREFLLRQKFRSTQSIKPTGQTKVVTPDDDDYIDPYLNIKGSDIRKPNTHSISKQDYIYQDYVEDYVVELPKPGLVGLYSDNGQRPPWSYPDEDRPSYGGSVDDSEEDDVGSFGYSTVDPRRGTPKVPKRGRPVKLTTSHPEESAFDLESQTVSFQSTPNFQVLQGFKLPNLGRNKHKFYSKNTRRSTTDGNTESDSIEPENFASHPGVFTVNPEFQVYENCGKTSKQEVDRNDKQFGDADSGSHPWMALAVLSRQPQGILCYATIIHPRAAVTAGDCVYRRTSPKEVTLLAGLWNLSDRSKSQNRVVTVQLHPQYRAEVLAHDLALLHWETPLKLNADVQPACLGNPRDIDDCKFYGWGGFDQGIRPRSRWQRASVISKEECIARLGKAVTMPDNAFCAIVQSQGTVTGIGGSLICNSDGLKATSGVAVWRDNVLVLIPAQEWIIRAFQDLNID